MSPQPEQDPQSGSAARAIEFTDAWSPDNIIEQDYEGAREAFNNMVDRIITTNPDHADVDDGDEFCWTTMRYATYFPEDNSTLLFTVKSIQDKNDRGDADRTIEITTVIPGKPSREISYVTYGDSGFVHREENDAEPRKRSFAEILNELKNIELARQMGVRETPVNKTEVQKLEALLQRSTIDDSWREIKAGLRYLEEEDGDL